jgi:class 3 adenylate cyclase
MAALSGALQFRIGLSLGDILIEEGDVFGDGVNLAARLEGLASRVVYWFPPRPTIKWAGLPP